MALLRLRFACMVLAGAAMLAAASGQAVAQSAAQSAGSVVDEAMAAKRSVASFPQADEDYFHDMDGGMALSPAAIRGRNMWNVWTGGDDRFWDGMTNST